MDKEIKELTHQRDKAISRLEEYLRSEGEYPTHDLMDPIQCDPLERVNSGVFQAALLGNNDDDFLSEGTSPTMYIDKYFGPEPCRGWEKIHGNDVHDNFEHEQRIVQCIESKLTKKDMVTSSVSTPKGDHQSTNDENLRNSSPNISRSRSCTPPMGGQQSTKEEDVHDLSLNTSRSRSYSEYFTMITRSVSSELEYEMEDASNEEIDDQRTPFDLEPSPCSEYLTAKESRSSIGSEFMISSEEHIIKQLDDSLREVNEAINAELMKQYADDLVVLNTYPIKPKSNKKVDNTKIFGDDTPNQNDSAYNSDSDWRSEFERQRKEIIELWNTCNIPLVHRTYFFLLFQGDPSDAVYMEVEVRRLSYLKNALHGVRVGKDDQPFTWASR